MFSFAYLWIGIIQAFVFPSSQFSNASPKSWDDVNWESTVYRSRSRPFTFLSSQNDASAEKKAVAVREEMLARRLGVNTAVDEIPVVQDIEQVSASFQERLLIARIDNDKKAAQKSDTNKEEEEEEDYESACIEAEEGSVSTDVYPSSMFQEKLLLERIRMDKKAQQLGAEKSIDENSSILETKILVDVSNNNEIAMTIEEESVIGEEVDVPEIEEYTDENLSMDTNMKEVIKEDIENLSANISVDEELLLADFTGKDDILDVVGDLSIAPISEDQTFSCMSDKNVRTVIGEEVKLGAIVGMDGNSILVCLSHFGDFNAWEVAQQYINAVEKKSIPSDTRIVLVGIGSHDSAKCFARALDLEKHKESIVLLADEKASVTEDLGCYKGWLAIDKTHAEEYPATDVNPYIKLFGMIFGFGSPGTIQKVLYGYLGDKNGGEPSRSWVIRSLLSGSKQGRWPSLTEEAFDGIPSNSGLRPFELATLRLQTGLFVVRNWGALGPADGDLFTRMGGTFIFSSGKCKYEFFDKGILNYAPINDVLAKVA